MHTVVVLTIGPCKPRSPDQRRILLVCGALRCVEGPFLADKSVVDVSCNFDLSSIDCLEHSTRTVCKSKATLLMYALWGLLRDNQGEHSRAE
jgi:hypothetical protein